MLKKPTRHERLERLSYMVGVMASPETKAQSLDRDVSGMLQEEWLKARAAHEAETVLNNPEARQVIVTQFMQNIEKRLTQDFVPGCKP